MSRISGNPPRVRMVGIAFAVFIVGIAVGWWLPFGLKSDAHVLDTRAHRLTAIEQGEASAVISPSDRDATTDFLTRLHTALAIQSRTKRERAIASIADPLDATQLREAAQRLASLHISARQEVLAQLFARWGAIDAQSALEFREKLPKASDRRQALVAIINGWIETDLDGAEHWIDTLPDGSEKTMAWKALLEAQGPVDPQRAVTNLNRTDIVWPGDVVVHAIFDRCARDNPEEAVRLLDQVASPGLKTEAVRIVARQWAETDVSAAISWAQTLPDLIPFYGPGEGHEITAGADRSNALNALLETWLARDAGAAVDWLSELPEGLERVALIYQACRVNEEAVQNPDIAMRMAALLPEGELREAAIVGFLTQWAVYSPSAEFAWALSQTDLNLQRSALREVIPALDGTELRDALSFAATLPEAAKWIFSARSFADPRAVTHWLTEQPGNEQYIPQMAAAWATKDPMGPLEWLQTLPGEKMDLALNAMIERAVKDSGSAWVSSPIPLSSAAEFATQLTNPEARETALESVAKAWLKVSPDAAREWLESASISEAAKQRLLNSKPGR